MNKVECIVSGCTNRKDEGGFNGDICIPCFIIITKGKSAQPSTNFIFKMHKKIKELEKKVDSYQRTFSQIKEEEEGVER